MAIHDHFTVENLIVLLVTASSVAMYVSARMPYHDDRRIWLDALLIVVAGAGGLACALAVLVLHVPGHSRNPAISGFVLASPVFVAALAGDWARRRAERREARAESLPVARAVTLPPREPDTAGFWCTDCQCPHATSFCGRSDEDVVDAVAAVADAKASVAAMRTEDSLSPAERAAANALYIMGVARADVWFRGYDDAVAAIRAARDADADGDAS